MLDVLRVDDVDEQDQDLAGGEGRAGSGLLQHHDAPVGRIRAEDASGEAARDAYFHPGSNVVGLVRAQLEIVPSARRCLIEEIVFRRAALREIVLHDHRDRALDDGGAPGQHGLRRGEAGCRAGDCNGKADYRYQYRHTPHRSSPLSERLGYYLAGSRSAAQGTGLVRTHAVTSQTPGAM